MKTAPKPEGLLSRFNKSAKSILAAAAVGLTLMGSAAAADTPPASPQPQTTQTPAAPEQIGNYQFDGKRTIRITGTIDRDTSIAVINRMLALSKDDPKADIELRINSPGGVVNEGLAIYDVMKSLPNDVRTVCEGEAQSMAAFLLVSGTPGKRFAYPSCEIMLHQPSWGESGQMTEMDVTTAQGNVLKDRLIKMVSHSSGLPEKLVKKLIERNFYPSAEEAKELGLIDNIIGDPSPDPTPAPKTTLPPSFCDNPGRKYLDFCSP